MGIKFHCPNGHKLNVKSFLAGKRGICPHCGIGVDIPSENGAKSRKSGRSPKAADTVPETPSQPAGRPLPTPMPAAASVDLLPASHPIRATMPSFAAQPSVESTSAAAQPLAGTAATPLVQIAEVRPATAPAADVSLLADPIAESPNAVWYVRPPSGGQFGPAKGDIMRKWIADGRVSADSLVWREGWPDWKTAGPVFPALSRGLPPVAPAPAAASASAMPAVTLSQPLASAASTAKSRGVARGKNSTSMQVAVVVLLAVISVILIVVLILLATGNLFSGSKENDASQLPRIHGFDHDRLLLDSGFSKPSAG